MQQYIKDSRLDGLKGTVHYCAECGKLQVHFAAVAGWPICHACGYNAHLDRVSDEEPAQFHHEAAPRLAAPPVLWAH